MMVGECDLAALNQWWYLAYGMVGAGWYPPLFLKSVLPECLDTRWTEKAVVDRDVYTSLLTPLF